ncbi:MAG: hypothetical protein JNG88_00350 [Phycisphaerales bacterium]|nr:hypothetical protein [Phycisphaerales bacterium]
MFADAEYSPAWPAALRLVRKNHFGDGRRMAFKSLKDRHRAGALTCFLNAADSLCGLLCTVAVDKRYEWMASSPNTVKVWGERAGLKGRWDPATFEEMSRVVVLWSFILSHLVRGHQAVNWITDQDEIAANDDRLTDLLEFAGRMSSFFIQKPMLELAVNTTAYDDGTGGFEDFTAIPDLAAGAFAEVATRWPSLPIEPIATPKACVISDLSPKSDHINDWLSSSGGLLRKVCVLLRVLPDGRTLIQRIQSTSDDPTTIDS